MKTLVLLLLCFAPLAASAAEQVIDYSTDADVRALSATKEFAFGLVFLMRRTQSEAALARILRREDKIRPLIEVYNRGTPEAKAYALAAFHYLSPELYQQCRKDIVGSYNPKVRVLRGCCLEEGSFLELAIRIHHGEYDDEIKKYAKG